MKKIFLYVFAVLSVSALFTSCDDDTLKMPDIQPETKEFAMTDFAAILSKVVHNNKQVRELLKKEAIDGDGNIPYESVRDVSINGITLHNILIANSSTERLKNIETMLPHLNIYFPNITMFGKTRENYDAGNSELPVAVPMPQEDLLFVGEQLADILTKEDVPDFHVLVVKEECAATNADRKDISTDYISGTLKDAYKTFNREDASNYSQAYQRDFAYYGMTPDGTGGEFDANVKEYISYIEVNPDIYHRISDDNNERFDMVWTGNTYTFKFMVAKSTDNNTMVLRANLRPDDIWDFDINDANVRGAAFNSSKHVYTVNTYKLKAKRYYFLSDEMSLGSWNLADEAVSRYFDIEEEDESNLLDNVLNFSWKRLSPACFNGDRKLVLGAGTNIKNGLGYEANIITDLIDGNTIVSKPISDKSNMLGSLMMYYTDPLVKSIANDGTYLLHEYNTGCITFAIAVTDRTK